MSSACFDENHFTAVDGTLYPQPWMVHRPVGSVAADSKSVSYAAATTDGSGFLASIPILGSLLGGLLGGTGGGNKDELIHSLRLSWTNDSPIDQWCYGLVTRGGCRVTLQARSRGYLVVNTSSAKGEESGDLTAASVTGIGADNGRGGLLATGTGFCDAEIRQNSTTIPLTPERTGWTRLAPIETLTAQVEVRFTSDVWESSVVDGGDQETDSSFQSGDTRLDLYAIPIIE